MFGIGLPELIVILAVGLIVVGPEKMPELARSLAKGIVELKKAAGALKHSLHEEDITQDVNKVQDDITAAFQSLPAEAFSREKNPPPDAQDGALPDPADEQDAENEVIDIVAEETPDADENEKST